MRLTQKNAEVRWDVTLSVESILASTKRTDYAARKKKKNSHGPVLIKNQPSSSVSFRPEESELRFLEKSVLRDLHNK